MTTPAEAALKVADTFTGNEAARLNLKQDWPHLFRALEGLAGKMPELRRLTDDEVDAQLAKLLPPFVGGAHVKERDPWPDGTILDGVEWLVQISTGAVMTYVSEGDARRAFRTEYGRRFMVRWWDDAAGVPMLRDLTGEL